MVPIKIKIDDNISINMEIKEEMTSLEFLGLMTKAKKLFNISEIEVVSSKTEGSGKYSGWTKEDFDKVKEMYRKVPVSKIAEALNRPINSIYNKISQLKAKGELI